jgi:hypothetical protein
MSTPSTPVSPAPVAQADVSCSARRNMRPTNA